VLALAEYEVRHEQQEGQAVHSSILNVKLSVGKNDRSDSSSAGDGGDSSSAGDGVSAFYFKGDVCALAEREIAITYQIDRKHIQGLPSSMPTTDVCGRSSEGSEDEDALLLAAAAATAAGGPVGV
jgi:hypothetical protein